MEHQAKVINFAEDLAVLLNSGTDLNSSLATIIETQPAGPFKTILEKIRAALLEGHALEQTLRSRPDVFSHYFISMVKSGQASGRLPEALEALSMQLERDRELRSQIVNALLYPAILMVAMFVSLGIILTLILPRFTALFESFGTQLSPAAHGMLAVGNFLNNWGSMIAAILIAAATASWLFRDRLKPGAHLMRMVRKIPALNTLLDEMDFARFSASLASLLDSGLTQTEALTVAAESFSQQHNREQLNDVIEQVNQGQLLGNCLADVNGVSQLYAHSISNGEQGGQLPATLRKLAQKLEKDFNNKTQRIVLIVEPLMIILLGLIVGLVIYTVFSALQNLTNLPL